MSSKKFSSLCYNAKTTLIDIVKSIKWQVIFCAVIILIGFIIGMYYGFAYIGADFTDENLLVKFLSGEMSTFSTLVCRILSSVIVMFLLLLFSKSKWLSPLAILLIFYRAYLLGINIAIMLKFYGVSGIIVAILILFPLQLFQLIFFSIFYFSLLCGECGLLIKSIKKYVLLSMLAIIIINFVIAILLCLFSPNIILIL